MNKLNRIFALILGLSVFAGTAAFAETPDERTCPLGNCGSPSENRYEALGKLFDNGTLPTSEDMIGWYSGRCYAKLAVNKALAAIFVGYKTGGQPGDDNGPEFPENQVCAYVPLTTPTGPATFFDILTPSREAIVVDFVREFSGKVQAPVVEDGSLVVHATQGEDGKWLLRKSKGYLVVKFLSEKYWTYEQNCYYFKKVK